MNFVMSESMQKSSAERKVDWIFILKEKFKDNAILLAERGNPWGYSQSTIRPVGPESKEIDLFAFYMRKCQA